MTRLGVDGRRIAVLAVMLLAPAARAAAPDAATANAANAKALRTEATKLFKQKKYAAACDKFQAAVAAAPEDVALLTDLALCQQKLEKKAEATASNLRAIELASRDGKRIDDPAAARERRHAYFNLDQLGASLTHDLASDGECGALAAPTGCAATFHACAYIDTRGVGRQRQFDRRTMKLGLTPADATWTKDVRSSQEDDQPSLGDLTDPSPAVPEKVEGGWLTVITYCELEPPQHVCDYDQWSCEKSDAVEAAARVCLTAAGLALKPNELIQETPCFDKLCRELDKKPSKAVLREKRRAQKHVDRCESTPGDEGYRYACSIVYANACTGLLGVVCGSDDVEVRGKPAVRVEEFRFVRGK